MPTPALATDAVRGSTGGAVKAAGATTAAIVALSEDFGEGGAVDCVGERECGDFWLSIARWKRHSPNLKGA